MPLVTLAKDDDYVRGYVAGILVAHLGVSLFDVKISLSEEKPEEEGPHVTISAWKTEARTQDLIKKIVNAIRQYRTYWVRMQLTHPKTVEVLASLDVRADGRSEWHEKPTLTFPLLR